MRPLDSISFPLHGASLIEASAGTGKTYTIVNLYIRLLLGHQCQALSVEQILVVTFTKAATAELKERIRQRIRSLYLAFYVGNSEDKFIQSLIDQSEDLDADTKRLDLAAKQMDEAAIFTIHGFCQRMLTQHAFESGALYEQSMILDQSEWLTLATLDYWRKYIVRLPKQFLSLFYQHWSSPEHLKKSIGLFVSRDVVSEQRISLEQCLQDFNRLQSDIVAFKRWWLTSDVIDALSQAKLKKNTIIGNPNTLIKMQEFCNGSALEPDIGKSGWEIFSHEKLAKARTKDSPNLDQLDLSRCEHIALQYAKMNQNIKLAFSLHSLEHIKANLANNKRLLNLLSPDDLLSQLQRSLYQDKLAILANTIRGMFPAALIDEFQDTDPTQFSIFEHIYPDEIDDNEFCWIMIGDPKQAIYAFRGADIFTYIQAKQRVSESQQFTLAQNWRSSASLINSVNQLFSYNRNSFLFENKIPFVPVEPAKRQGQLVTVDGQPLPSMRLSFLSTADHAPIKWSEAQHLMATDVANQIASLLQSNTRLNDQELTQGDCCVLVRDRVEAELIKSSLFEAGILGVFLERRSVFTTQTAADLYLLLRAIANPSEERLLKAAFASQLFAMTGVEFDQLFSDENAWQTLVDNCFKWQQVWQHTSVMLMLNQVYAHFDIYKKLTSHYEDGLRRVTDLRHLTELAQHQSSLTPTESQILHWYSDKLSEPDNENEGQQLRLESDANLVQIMTMHSSKGLEFPFVFIPFASRYRETKEAIYHDRQQRLLVDFLNESSNLAIAQKERLAEDVRLLYVALTRAINHCYVGLWNNAHTNRKNQSDVLSTALGQLLFYDIDDIDSALMIDRLNNIVETCDISLVRFAPDIESIRYHSEATENNTNLYLSQLSQPIMRNWRLTSYSAISRQQQHNYNEQPGNDELHLKPSALEIVANVNPPKSKFTFVKGAQAGSFLHGVLENIEFHDPQNLDTVIEQQGQWYGIEESWYETIKHWILEVLATPLSSGGEQSGFSLSVLQPHSYLVEMEFHLPLVSAQESDFNDIINRFYPQEKRHYQFNQLNGMLKGFIDLTVCYQGKYFVIDYKSNYLGDSEQDYQGAMLDKAMQEHDYKLQLVLYTLALHRWLSIQQQDYQYEQHIGGAYYMFLRGMKHSLPGNGVFYHRPDKALIEALDRLFKGERNVQENPVQSNLQLDMWDQ